MAVIEGESGVGKTRLAEESRRARVQEPARRRIAARPSAGERGLAYGVVAQLLRAAVRGDRPRRCRAHCRPRPRGCCPSSASRPPTSAGGPGRAAAVPRGGVPAARRSPATPRAGRSCSSTTCTARDPASLDALGYSGPAARGPAPAAAGHAAHRRARPRPRLRAASPSWASGSRSSRLTARRRGRARARAAGSARATRTRCTPRARACRCSWPSCWRAGTPAPTPRRPGVREAVERPARRGLRDGRARCSRRPR